MLLNYIIGGEFYDLDNTKYYRNAEIERKNNSSKCVLTDKLNQKIVLKTHKKISSFENIDQYAGVFCVVRDPKDIIASYYYYQYFFLVHKKSGRKDIPEYTKEEEIKNLDNIIKKVVGEWHQFQSEFADYKNIIYVRYESLHNNPARHLSEVLQKSLQVTYNENLIQEAIKMYDFSSITGRKAGEEVKHSFFRKGTIGDHKNILSQEQILKIKNELSPILKELKYL